MLFYPLSALFLGYMIVLFLSFNTQQKSKWTFKHVGSQYEKTLDLRNQLIAQEETNRKLQKELNQKQDKVLKNEKDLSKETQVFLKSCRRC